MWHRPGPGQPRTIGDEELDRVIVKTLEESPTDATHWSTRSMAKTTGMSQSAHQPHLAGIPAQASPAESFKLSPDAQCIDKERDIVALYLNPPEAAGPVRDEKSQI